MARLDDQVARGTGAAGGICPRLAAASWTVANHVLTGDHTARRPTRAPCIRAAVRVGQRGILCTTAGIITRHAPPKTIADDCARTTAMIVAAHFRLCRAVRTIPEAETGRAIVNTAFDRNRHTREGHAGERGLARSGQRRGARHTTRIARKIALVTRASRGMTRAVASEAAGFVAGQVVTIGGGRMARMYQP
jgi:hypothetical protein